LIMPGFLFAATVDRRVNDWLAESKVIVRKTNVAFKGMREP
jgi:hypothetical protein